MKRLVGKTALITGASSGIGRAIARKFHAEGAEQWEDGVRACLPDVLANLGAVVVDVLDGTAAFQLRRLDHEQ